MAFDGSSSWAGIAPGEIPLHILCIPILNSPWNLPGRGVLELSSYLEGTLKQFTSPFSFL